VNLAGSEIGGVRTVGRGSKYPAGKVGFVDTDDKVVDKKALYFESKSVVLVGARTFQDTSSVE